ncbi:MAG: FAD-dependent oxidoreductase [Alphaproteobacteria bacterium]
MIYRPNRRLVLSGLAGLASAPLLPSLARANGDADVIVIGAGIAGVTAAREVLAQGLSVTVVEARNRIGGRAYTESETFGVPYDHGCAWLHSANVNPLTEMVQRAGYETYDEQARGPGFISTARKPTTRLTKSSTTRWRRSNMRSTGSTKKSGRPTAPWPI